MTGATSCRDEARRWVHRYAVGGAAFAALPLPVTSSGLVTLETHMCGAIARIYGERLGLVGTTAAGGSFALLGRGLKWVASRASEVIPVPGVVIRVAIAGGAVLAFGYAITEYFEHRHPGKVLARR